MWRVCNLSVLALLVDEPNVTVATLRRQLPGLDVGAAMLLHGPRVASSGSRAVVPSDALRESITQANAHDVQLFAFARQVLHLRAAALGLV